MERVRAVQTYFTKEEKTLWLGSILVIVLFFYAFDRTNYLTLLASMLGVTSLIFNAKGNPIGQCLMIIFSILYGIISYSFTYYGEMITYLGMTLPMAVLAYISWMKNPYDGNKAEVKIHHLTKQEWIMMSILSILITFVFYFILQHFHTANMIPSTISVTTSFIAVYLTYRRSPYFAIGYAANDLVLILLWTLAAQQDITYISVVVCFIAFFVNDLYGYINWSRMKKRQQQNKM